MLELLTRLTIIYSVGAGLIILGYFTHNIPVTIGIYTLGVLWGFATSIKEEDDNDR